MRTVAPKPMTAPAASSRFLVRVLPSVESATQVALGELCDLVAAEPRALVSFATGGTFTAMLQALDRAVSAGRCRLDQVHATHLDEYLGFAPVQHGGMVHELCTACPSLRVLLQRGQFLPVPGEGTAAAIARHEAQLRELGGPRLQFLGIGRNGHVAFNEPGARFDAGFHVTDLAETTRKDAAQRFAPAPVPFRAVTAGIASILAAKRLILCAYGAGKAPAVKAMLEGPIGSDCPASAIRTHRDVLVLLDPAAASGLTNTAVQHG